MNEHTANLGMMSYQHMSLQSIVAFLDQKYHYKSVVTQIPYDTIPIH